MSSCALQDDDSINGLICQKFHFEDVNEPLCNKFGIPVGDDVADRHGASKIPYTVSFLIQRPTHFQLDPAGINNEGVYL